MAESAGAAWGQPCILRQPLLLSSQNWPDGFGLPSYLGASPERWKGRAEAWGRGQGLLRLVLISQGWGLGNPLPSPAGLPGRAAFLRTVNYVGEALSSSASPNFKCCIQCSAPAVHSGSQENRPPPPCPGPRWLEQFHTPRTQAPPPALWGLLCPLQQACALCQSSLGRETTQLCTEWLSRATQAGAVRGVGESSHS